MIRKVRCDGGGGVFLTFDNNLVEMPKLDADAEMIWARFHGKGSKPVYICSFYRAPNSNSDPSFMITYNSLYRLRLNNSQATIILAGDFNIPGISWENGIRILSDLDPIIVRDISISSASSFCYLGSLVDSHGGVQLELNTRTS